MNEKNYPVILVQPISSSLKVERLLELKKLLKPWSFILGQERTTSFDKDFEYLEVESAYKAEFVISVDRISNVVINENLEDKINLFKPLSLNFMHLDKFKCLKEFKNWQFDKVNNVSLDKSVQLKSKNYKFLTVDDFNSYIKFF
jgi:hypothetical protein